MQKLFALSLGFAAVILVVQQARAEPFGQCGDRKAVVAALADKYGESRRAAGLAGPQGMMEVYASDATGTWTITVTMPDGVTCLVASGDQYRPLRDALPKPGDDT